MTFIGYHDTKVLPVKRADEIVIPAGTVVRSCNPSKKTYVTKRKQTVKVHHTMNGMSVNPGYTKRSDINRLCEGKGIDVNEHYFRWEFLMLQADEEQDPEVARMLRTEYHEYKIPVTNPSVCWPGTGGYWCEVDINDVLAANGLAQPVAEAA